MPSPDALRRYNEVIPGLGDRIVVQWESQTAHRQSLERQTIQNDILLSRLGLVAAFVIAVTFFMGGVFLIYNGFAWAGTTIITSTVVSLVGLFIYGTNNRRQERDRKARLMSNPDAKPKKQSKGRKAT